MEILDVLFNLPAWPVALSAFILTVTILRQGKHTYIPIRLFALSSGAQMFLYILFQFSDIPTELRQFAARSLAITMNISLTFLIIYGRL
jgi:hypothetical protein